jgi:hypothetical protein
VPIRVRPVLQNAKDAAATPGKKKPQARTDQESLGLGGGGGHGGGGGGHGGGHGGGAADDIAESGHPVRGGGARGGGGGGGGSGGHHGGGHGARPHTAWMGETEGEDGGFDESQAFALLQQLLSGRRDLIGKLRPSRQERQRHELSTHDLLGALDGMPTSSTSPTGNPRSLLDVKQTLLAQSRQVHGKAAQLSREDSDAFELLGMLYSQIEREVRRDTPAVGLLGRLQVPLLRIALQDRAFFVRQQHPARQLLNAVAESGANWLGEEDVDPQLVHSLRNAVEHVVQNFREDPAAFDTANRELQTSLQQLARKAEVTERRHVEAARGKEKLELRKNSNSPSAAPPR